MLVKFLNSKKIYIATLKVISANVVELTGDVPRNMSGFEVVTSEGNRFGKYHDYTTIYKRVPEGYQFSNNESVEG